MNNQVIITNNVGKKFFIGSDLRQSLTLRDTLSNIGRKSLQREFWALKNISFEVDKGEVLGIIGKNGSGKSTLLKILSRISSPSEGFIELNGTVGSLLEVGTGFHPELSGRENVFLSGSILGMKKKEISEKFEDIVKFADIGPFIDTPVKRYSSGMYVRLAFSVAAHLDPDILIVDEVLAVGDYQFQKKCLGKMKSFSQEGRTVLFVSHNLVAIESLCDRCLLLDQGKIIQNGDSKQVIDFFINSTKKRNQGHQDLLHPELRKNSLKNSFFKWTDIALYNSKKEISSSIFLFEPFEIHISGFLSSKTDSLKLGFSIDSPYGIPLFNSYASDEGFSGDYLPGKISYAIKFKRNYLAPGNYIIGLGANGLGITDWIPDALNFTIESVSYNDYNLRSNFSGMIVHPCKWENLD